MIETLAASPVIHAVGLSLLHFLWQGAAIGLGAALLLSALKSFAPSVRYVVACFALAAMTITPVMTMAVLTGSSRRSGAALVTAAPSAAGTARPSPDLSGTTQHPATRAGVLGQIDQSLPLVTFAWALGVLGFTLRLTYGWLRVERVRRRGLGVVGQALVSSTTYIAAQLGIARPVAIAQSSMVDVPTVVGWLRPAILMPASALAQLSPWQLEAIVAHELAHIRRHDYAVNALQNIVETLFFFHPAVWWLSNRTRLEREDCCDDMAVAVCGNPVSYARALATLEESRQGRTAFGMAATGGSLLSRVQRLLGAPGAARGSTPLPISMTVCLALFATAAAVSSAPNLAAPARPTESAVPTAADSRIGERPAVSAAHGTEVRPESRTSAPQGPRTSVDAYTALLENDRKLKKAADEARLARAVPQSTVESDRAAVMLAEITLREVRALHDMGGLSALLSDDYVEIDRTGATRDKTRALEAATPVRTLTTGSTSIAISGDIAAVTGSQVETRTDPANPLQVTLFARVWRRQSDSKWKLISDSQFTDTKATNGTEADTSAPETQRLGKVSESLSVTARKPAPDSSADRASAASPLVRVGGDTKAPVKVKNVNPRYPKEAQEAGVQGMVIIEATIDPYGTVVDTRVLRSVPGLDQAAVDAVLQWKYTPTTLNGQAVAVIMTVTVNFTLQ